MMGELVDIDQLRSLLQPGFSLQDALETLLLDDAVQNIPEAIYVEPPTISCLTDEESGDEDEGGDLRHLSGNQLLAPAELVFDSGRIGGQTDEIDAIPTTNHVMPTSEEISSLPGISHSRLYHFAQDWLKEECANHEKVKYLQGVITPRSKVDSFPQPDYADFQGKTPVQVFEMFFSDEVIQLIVQESNKYASYRYSENPEITEADIKCFIGILILTSYNHVPSKRHYWEKEEDVRNELVCRAMRRTRFFTIMKHFHCADNNNLDRSDKFCKLRPLMDLIQRNFVKNFVPERHLNYDESMIKYFGKHGSKQFIRGKPIRFGFKAWCVNTSEGYCVNFDIYQGKDKCIPDLYSRYFGKASAPFLKLIGSMPESKQALPYNFYFDNLFSSPNLFTFLRFCGYQATGTIRGNRVPKEVIRVEERLPKRRTQLRSGRIEKRKQKYKKVLPEILSPTHLKARGQYCSAVERKSGLFFLRWMDSGVVTVLSTIHGIQPLKPVKRYVKLQKKNVIVPRPFVISMYNTHMGGTDQMDWNVYKYRINLRGKKWTWNITTWILDVAIQNAWLMYRKHNKKMVQLDFRRCLVQYYLSAYGTPTLTPGPLKTPLAYTTRVIEDIRFDDKGHYVQSTDEGKRRRCAYEECNSRVRTICGKCDVGLCVPHFGVFHQKK